MHNSLLNGHVFKTYVGIDWLSCAQECDKEDMCFSYNFFSSGEICELNNSGLKDPCNNADNRLTRNAGWIYHEIGALQDMKKSEESREIPVQNITAVFTCDNEMEMFADGVSLGKDDDWTSSTEYVIPENTRVISVSGVDKGSQFGILGSLSNGMVTNASWKCHTFKYSGWKSPEFDDSNWPAAVEVANHGDWPWHNRVGIASTAKWIWAAGDPDNVYCRLRLP